MENRGDWTIKTIKRCVYCVQECAVFVFSLKILQRNTIFVHVLWVKLYLQFLDALKVLIVSPDGEKTPLDNNNNYYY